MARARNIKPSFFKNEILGQEDPMISLLYISLWTLADKAGRLADIPIRIKAETFPYREGLDVNGYLTVLERTGFIKRYKVGDLAVIQIIAFEKHQNPHHTEKPSDLPEYSMESDGCTITVKEPLNNRLTPADSIKDSIKDSNISASPPVSEKPKTKAKATALPEGFGISENVAAWAKTKGFGQLEKHLEHFRGYAIAKAVKYADWDQAFMNAIRGNWAKLTPLQNDLSVQTGIATGQQVDIANLPKPEPLSRPVANPLSPEENHKRFLAAMNQGLKNE